MYDCGPFLFLLAIQTFPPVDGCDPVLSIVRISRTSSDRVGLRCDNARLSGGTPRVRDQLPWPMGPIATHRQPSICLGIASR